MQEEAWGLNNYDHELQCKVTLSEMSHKMLIPKWTAHKIIQNQEGRNIIAHLIKFKIREFQNGRRR